MAMSRQNSDKPESSEIFPIDSVFKNLRLSREALEGASEAGSNYQNIQDTRERSELSKQLGKLLIILTLVSFIFVGIIINILQLFLCLTVRFSNNRQWRRWHKLANGYLIYLVYTQPIFLIYIWPRVDMKIYMSDRRMLEDVKKEILAIIIANHTYELDWMMCFLMSDQMGNIGSYKCFAKDELKWLPVIGWSLWMSDLIYVRRDWNQDKLGIEKKLDELLLYDQILLGIFAEGTRLTKEKYAEAVEFAREKKLEPYKYHLFPRARGFNFTLRHYLRAANQEDIVAEKSVKLYNLQIVLPERPNFKHFLEGSYIKADIYCEEINITAELRSEARNSTNADDCPVMTRTLRGIYRRKDQILDEYQKDGCFKVPNDKAPNGCLCPLKKPYGVGMYWALFMSFTYGTLAYLATTVFARSFGFWTFIVIFMTSGMLMLRQIEKESKANNLRMLKSERAKMAQKICDPKAA